MTADEIRNRIYHAMDVAFRAGYDPTVEEIREALAMIHEAQVEAQTMTTGWICPKCGRVYAPSVKMCGSCSGPAAPTATDRDTPDACPSCHGPRQQGPMTGCPQGWHWGTWV